VTQPFLGQIQPFGFNFAPRGWALCNGQLMAISQNTALFSLLGTTYGGNGTSTFALPDLRGRVPMKFGTPPGGPTYDQGEQAGVETVTLGINEMPLHTHAFSGTSALANNKEPVAGSAYAHSAKAGVTSPDGFYAPDTTPQPINPATVGIFSGSNQPHTNLQPYLTISWCIAMNGIFPSRN
jgi:microcystin-dependent protein